MGFEMAWTRKEWVIEDKSCHAAPWNLGIKDTDTLKLVVQIMFKNTTNVWAECEYVPFTAAAGEIPEIPEHLKGTRDGKKFMISRDATGKLTCEVSDDDIEGPVTGWTALEGAG